MLLNTKLFSTAERQLREIFSKKSINNQHYLRGELVKHPEQGTCLGALLHA